MLPIGAQPTATGGTKSPVWPNGLRARGSAAVVAMGNSSSVENLNRRMLSEQSRRGNGGSGPLHLGVQLCRGGEMADTPALGAGGRKAVRVRIPLPAPDVQVVPLSLETRVITRVSSFLGPSNLAPSGECASLVTILEPGETAE